MRDFESIVVVATAGETRPLTRGPSEWQGTGLVSSPGVSPTVDPIVGSRVRVAHEEP